MRLTEITPMVNTMPQPVKMLEPVKAAGAFQVSPRHRTDIEGLRAIAVLAVIIFHIGFLPNGYLGVDVFFVISGFLITGIIFREMSEERFSLVHFYLRRIRRIIPLVSFFCVVSLAVGMLVMLPDDLENLAQSVVATNFFGNNILQALTTKNYWNVINDYKPLMHTWSLGIEEQFYMLYPFLFVWIGQKRLVLLPYVLVTLTLASLVLFLIPGAPHEKFYYLPFRFFELSFGGIIAIFLKGRVTRYPLGVIGLLALLLVLVAPLQFIQPKTKLVFVVLMTAFVLSAANTNYAISRLILTNPIARFCGSISFSLYMWHHVLLAFARYFVVPELSLLVIILILALTFLLSVLTYTFIEIPFRDRRKLSASRVLIIVSSVFVATNAASFYIYAHAGVLRDIPELGLSIAQSERGLHNHYNDRVYYYDRPFTEGNRVKVLVVGNSFARDWANVLLETPLYDEIELSYLYSLTDPKLADRARKADLIFAFPASREWAKSTGIDERKLWSIGTKNFGRSNGYFYNNRSSSYCEQRTAIDRMYHDQNLQLKLEFPSRYIDLIEAVIDQDKTVPVFTPDCRFISQDCTHFTVFGAKYYATLFEDQIADLLRHAKSEIGI